MGTSKTRWIPVTRSLYSFFHVLFGRIFSSAVAENRCRTEKNIFVSYGSTLLLIGLYAVVVIVNLYLGKILSAKQYEFIHANDHYNALGGYLAGIMTDERNSKDIRLYDLSKLFWGNSDRWWRAIVFIYRWEK